MTITTPNANAFTTACRKKGVAVPTVGLSALRDLIVLREAPSPARPITPGINNTRYSKLRHVGLLIVNGLAAFDRAEQHYCITEAGLDWLERLQAVGIISPH